MNFPIWIIIGFQQQDRESQQNLNNDTFSRLPVISAQCIFGTEKYPDAGILLIYNDDDYSQGYGQIKEAFRALTKVDNPNCFITDHAFKLSNDGNDIGYNFYVFGINYQKSFAKSQAFEIKFKFDGVVPADTNGYDLVLTHKLVIISSDAQRPFDLI